MCYAQIIGSAMRKARKVNKHRCWWCSEPIVAGEEYEDQRVVPEGERRIDVIVTHKECLGGIIALRKAGAGDDEGCIWHEGDGVRGSTRRKYDDHFHGASP